MALAARGNEKNGEAFEQSAAVLSPVHTVCVQLRPAVSGTRKRLTRVALWARGEERPRGAAAQQVELGRLSAARSFGLAYLSL